jgi:hypothetical protein
LRQSGWLVIVVYRNSPNTTIAPMHSQGHMKYHPRKERTDFRDCN